MSAVQDIFAKRSGYFLGDNPTLRGGIIFCILIGALTFLVAMSTGSSARVLGSLLFNIFFFYGIAIIGVAFAAMQDVIGATWGRPIKKIHEAFGSFLPISGLILAIYMLCIIFKVKPVGDLYPWIRNPEMLHHFPGKDVWLRPYFMAVRDLGAIAAITALSQWQLRLVKKRDKLFVDGHLKEAMAEGRRVRDLTRYWSAPILVVYSLCFSLLGFDLLMSLAPTWFSTLWGGWLFAIAMQTHFAVLLLVLFALRNTQIGQVYKRQQFHDVGKLLYGFTIFFAYTTYAHVLTYWFGNIPEETEYFIHRLHSPWLYIVLIAPIFNFLIPMFALIPKAAKWTPVYTPILCLSILAAQWSVYMLIVMPEIIKVDGFYFPIIELGIFLGVLGLFLGSIRRYGKTTPLIGVADPLLYEHLDSAH